MIDRRAFVTVAGATLAGSAMAQAPATAYGFSFEKIDGGAISLREFAGRPLLIVNTASRCGFTRQYAGLQDLWSRYRQRGLVVLGVPANDFAGQEPGSNEEIREFCSGTFGVTFPLAAKATVIGAEAHPFYRWAATQRPGEQPRWNFHKYLIGRDGRIAAVFPTSVEPTDPRVIRAIEQAFAGA
ncbi:MAG: glutathione peroxidase [Beijerinckiaceae bacterium]